MARTPLADEALNVLGPALRDPNVVLRFQAKISPCLGRSVCGGAGPSRGEVTDASERSWLAEHILPADQRWALLRRCLTDAQLSTPLRVAGSLVLLYGQTPTRIVTLTQHDVTRLGGMTYITLHRQPVLMPTRLADLGRPARRVQHRAPRDRPDPAGPVHPSYSPAHDLAHTNEPDISARRSMNSSDCRFVLAAAPSCDLADELAAAVLAALLGISVDTAGRWGALVKRDWTGYIAERDGQPSGPQQT